MKVTVVSSSKPDRSPYVVSFSIGHFPDALFGQFIASMVITFQLKASSSSKIGTAVISVDFLSMATCPRQILKTFDIGKHLIMKLEQIKES